MIGITGSLGTTLCIEQVRRRAERRSLTGAIVGEIAALIQIVERRHYIEDIRELIAEAEAGKDPNLLYWYQFSIRRNPFSVYDANVARLGMLRDPLPRLISQFYTQASSILEDIADMREGRLVPPTRESSVQRLKELVKLFEDTTAVGHQIVDANP